MNELNILGRGIIQMEHLIPGVVSKTRGIGDRSQRHMLTADTHGRQSLIGEQLDVQAVRIQKGDEARTKAEYVQKLDPAGIVAMGQGNKDSGILEKTAFGIALYSHEGPASEALQQSDVLAPDILSTLALLNHPFLLVATLRQ